MDAICLKNIYLSWSVWCYLSSPVTAYSHHHNEMHKGKEVSICDPHQSICYVCNGQVVNKHYMCIGSYRQLFGQPWDVRKLIYHFLNFLSWFDKSPSGYFLQFGNWDESKLKEWRL